MRLKKLIACLCAATSTLALAQAPLGTVSNVQGVVAATQGTNVIMVRAGTPVLDGMRFVTTTGSNVTLSLNNGCVVQVSPGQAVTVLQSMPCSELIASVRPATAAAGQGRGSPFSSPPPFLFNGIIAAGGIFTLGMLVREIARDHNVSPN